jgi:hypothetical protein
MNVEIFIRWKIHIIEIEKKWKKYQYLIERRRI